MPKRRFAQCAMLIALVILPKASWADDLEDSIISQLKAQGYRDFSVSKTFLGRLRILANQDGTQREIVVNPRTGEVLRDQSYDQQGNGTSGPIPRLRDDNGRSDDRDQRRDDTGTPDRKDESRGRDSGNDGREVPRGGGDDSSGRGDDSSGAGGSGSGGGGDNGGGDSSRGGGKDD